MWTTLRGWIMALALIAPLPSHAEDAMIPLSLTDPAAWDYFSDQVMGGVSQGGVSFATVDGQPVLRLTGEVSTANRGGFIQARRKLDAVLAANAKGVVLSVRGNDQAYFVHLRTSGTMLPWQYYQATFTVTQTWSEVRIPFEAFVPSGRLLRKVPDPVAVRSLAVVAFGRDHRADLSVRAVGFY